MSKKRYVPILDENNERKLILADEEDLNTLRVSEIHWHFKELRKHLEKSIELYYKLEDEFYKNDLTQKSA